MAFLNGAGIILEVIVGTVGASVAALQGAPTLR